MRNLARGRKEKRIKEVMNQKHKELEDTIAREKGTDDGKTKGNTRIWRNQEELANPFDEAENVKLLVNHFLKQKQGSRSPIMSISTL